MLFKLGFVLGTFLTFGQLGFAKETHLRFAINAPGMPPYAYYDFEENQYQGVVIDFFKSFKAEDKVIVEYIDSNRARNEQFILNKKTDLFLGSKAWIKNVKQFSFSQPIMQHHSYMYAVKKFEKIFLPQEQNQTLICTRYKYSYPSLQPYFEDGSLIRVDSTTQITMAYMLSKNRCDYSIMSEENARAILSKSEFCDFEFHQSPTPIDSVNIVFVMGQHLALERAKIHHQLKVFIDSGARDKSVLQHAGKSTFPKLKCA